MAETDMHYIHYDPETIWNMITYTHIANGGDLLYPGDEKEILLRTVLALLVQGLSVADNALLMDSLQHTMDGFMDLYGRKRSCYRLEAQAAEAEVEIAFAASGIIATIPAGTALTADGQRIYLTKVDIQQTGFEQTSAVTIVAEEAGAAGNGLSAGTGMQFCIPNAAVTSITVTAAASGGRNRESDESYRERIREYGLASITTGPSQQYERVARSVSTDVLDAKAVRTAQCTVCVYVILSEESEHDAQKAAILTALSDETERPMTDLLLVEDAESLPYTLNVNCTIENSVSSETLTEAISEYKAWQDNKIQRPFNPEKLMAMLYQAGVSRVQWTEGSSFNGGPVEYTAIAENQRCAGTINLSITS